MGPDHVIKGSAQKTGRLSIAKAWSKYFRQLQKRYAGCCTVDAWFKVTPTQRQYYYIMEHVVTVVENNNDVVVHEEFGVSVIKFRNGQIQEEIDVQIS